jgi:DNA-directed RNA polymerase omega subunit
MAYRSIEEVPSRYELVHVIARRARKIQAGARPVVVAISRKPTRIAQQEVMAGLIDYIKPGADAAKKHETPGE